VLLTTFSKALANALGTRLQYLIGNEPDIAKRIEVHPVTGIAYEMYSSAYGQPNIASSALVRELLRQAAAAQVEGQRFIDRFLFGEWSDVVDAWQLIKELGSISRCSPPWPQDADRQQAAGNLVVDLRAGARGAGAPQGRHLVGCVRSCDRRPLRRGK
jgi:hypothetical protein